METRNGYDGTHIGCNSPSIESKENEITPENNTLTINDKKENEITPEKITLTEEEITHVVDINKKLDTQYMCIDMNMNDNDNIKQVLALCAHRQLNPFIITSYDRLGDWVDSAYKYGFVSCVGITYSSLIEPSVEDCEQIYMCHYRGKYYTTDLFKAHINSGSLIIFDNFQLIDSPTSGTQKACRTIVDDVVEANNNTRIMQKPAQIILRDCQVSCYSESIEHLNTQFSTINVSRTGMGKTVITLAICANKRLNPFVISTPAALIHWEDESGKYGFSDFTGVTYQSLRGIRGNTNHGYLTIFNGKYYPTALLQDIIRHGTLFIFDEVQLAKNPKTSTMKACHAIAKEVVRMNTTSRIAILSATPYDKIQFSESILKIAGIVTHDEMYYYDRSEKRYVMEGYGLHQLISWCDKINAEKTTTLLTAKKITKKVITNMCHDLFVGVIKDAFVTKVIGEMPTKLKIRNGYYKLSKYGSERVNMIETEMVEATGFDVVTGKIGSKIDLGRFQSAMHEMEIVKIEIVARIVSKLLDTNSKAKVPILVWHKDVIDELCRQLHKYNPLVINGSVKKEQRRVIMDRFNAPTNKYRLIILNIASGSEAISLGDTQGDWPRTSYMVPNFHYIKLSQACGRTQRMSSMSDAEVYFIFSESQTLEPMINEAMASKEKVVDDIVEGSGQQKIASAERYDEPE